MNNENNRNDYGIQNNVVEISSKQNASQQRSKQNTTQSSTNSPP